MKRIVVSLTLSVAIVGCGSGRESAPPAAGSPNGPDTVTPAGPAAPAAATPRTESLAAEPLPPPSPDEARHELGTRNISIAPESLVRAARDCDAGAAALLVAAGVPIDTPDFYGERPLLHVAKYGIFDPNVHGPESTARCRTTFQVLLRAGARPNVSHLAGIARYGEIDLARRLLDQGVDPNEAAAERMPCCPLQAAAGGGHLETVELFVARGAKVADDPQAMGHAVGAVHHVDPEGRVLRFLLAHGGDVNARVDDYRATPLMVAARRMLPTAVRILIDAGADVNLKDVGQQTALDRAREAHDDRGAVNPDIVAALERAGGRLGKDLR